MIVVDDVMTREPHTLSRLSSLADARVLMEEKRFRHVPIVDENKCLVGLVSQRNVLAHSMVDAAAVGKTELLENESGVLLADIMTIGLITIHAQADVRMAAQLILDRKIGCLPVVDHCGVLQGIVTDSDFVAISIQLLELMEHTGPALDDEAMMAD